MTRTDPSKQRVDLIGTTKSAELTQATSIANDISKSVLSLQLDAGTWLLIGSIVYATSGTGGRGAWIGTENVSAAVTWPAHDCVCVPGSTTNTARLEVTHVVSPSAATTYYLNAYQKSGGNFNVNSAKLTAVRLA